MKPKRKLPQDYDVQFRTIMARLELRCKLTLLVQAHGLKAVRAMLNEIKP